MKINQVVNESPQLCPECGGPAFSDLVLAEKQDACYHKVRSRYKVWPSAYASGALVQCRKKGADNWGNKSKNEDVEEGQLDEISANPDYLRAAERSRSQAQATQRTFGKSPEEKAAARRTEINRDKGIAGYTKRHKAAHPEMYPKVKAQPAPKLRDPSTEYSDDYSVWAAGRRDTMEQGVEEASIPYALSAANAAAEYNRQGQAGGGYRGRIDIPVGSREDYIASGKALKKAAAAAGQHIEYGLSNGVMSVFSDSMTSDELDSFIDDTLENFDQGVAESMDAESYKQKLLSSLPQMMRFYEKNVKGWKPSEEQMLAAVETGYMVMKHTGDVKQAGKAVMNELNTLHRMSQGQQGVAEAGPEATFNALKGLKTWQVVIMNNYYRGKYSDYSGRYYYVLASSAEEARQVVLDNADAILQDLLSMKSVNGKKILPRGSAIAITDKRIGDIKDGTEAGRMTTAGFKKMFGPQGPMMVKLANGAVADVQGQEQGVAEGSKERGQNRLWQMITDYEQRAKATKNDIKKAHYLKMASELRGKLKTSNEQGVAEDDAGDVEQRMIAKIEKEKQRLAKLKQTDPEAYKREMDKRKTSGRVPPVSTFEDQGVAEGSEQQWTVTVGTKTGGTSHTMTFTGTKEQAIKKAVARFGTSKNPVIKAVPAKQGVAEGDISQLEKDIADAPVKPIANMESATDSDGYSVDQEDAGEYDYEGDQAKDQLQTIVAAARKLDGILDDNENMPEWVQMKITKATDYLDTAADYVAANKAQAEPMAEGEPKKIGGRYDPDEFDAMVGRLKKLAGAGPLKTVYDPNTRRYKNVPTAVQPKDKK